MSDASNNYAHSLVSEDRWCFFTRNKDGPIRGHNLNTNTDSSLPLLESDGSQDAVPLTSSGGYWYKLG